MDKYYFYDDNWFHHHYKVIDDNLLLHVNESSPCINLVNNDINDREWRYQLSTKERFEEALKKTLNKLDINYGNFNFINNG